MSARGVGMIVDPGAAERLGMLRELTTLSGSIHEEQMLQIKLWPVALTPAASSVAKVDTDARSISIDLRAARRARVAHRPAARIIRSGSRRLAAAVRWLLGKDWSIEVLWEGKRIYLLDRETEAPTPKFAGTDFAAGAIVPETPWTFHSPPATPAQPSQSLPRKRSR